MGWFDDPGLSFFGIGTQADLPAAVETLEDSKITQGPLEPLEIELSHFCPVDQGTTEDAFSKRPKKDLNRQPRDLDARMIMMIRMCEAKVKSTEFRNNLLYY